MMRSALAKKETVDSALYDSLTSPEMCVAAFRRDGISRAHQSIALRRLCELLSSMRAPLDVAVAMLWELLRPGQGAGFAGAFYNLVEAARILVDALVPAGAAAGLVRVLERLVDVVEAEGQGGVSPAHNLFLQCCLLAGMPGRAERVASHPYTSVAPAASHGTTSADVLAFFYHAGCVMELTGKGQRALDCWYICITYPAHSLSAICVAAYRRFLLLSLVEEGAVRHLGDSREGFANFREVQNATPAYQAIRKAFAAADATALADAVYHHRAALEADGTLALAREVLLSLGRRRVQTMTDTYVTVPLAEVAKRVGISEPVAERIVFSAIFQGKIAASIDQGRGLVSFSDSSVPYGDPSVSHGLSSIAAQAAAMTREVKLANEAFDRRRDYIDRVAEQDKSAIRAGAGTDRAPRGGDFLQE